MWKSRLGLIVEVLESQAHGLELNDIPLNGELLNISQENKTMGEK